MVGSVPGRERSRGLETPTILAAVPHLRLTSTLTSDRDAVRFLTTAIYGTGALAFVLFLMSLLLFVLAPALAEWAFLVLMVVLMIGGPIGGLLAGLAIVTLAEPRRGPFPLTLLPAVVIGLILFAAGLLVWVGVVAIALG